jgi:hypothetical protein
MLITAPPFVYPNLSYDALGIAVATQMRAMLKTGSEVLNQAGLDTFPMFLNRDGKGSGRNKRTDIAAKVIFYDDEPPGTPYVQILGIRREGEVEWGDTRRVLCSASLDCFANQFMPRALTKGVDSAAAQNVLGNRVEAMLRNEILMASYGFTDVGVSPSAPPDMVNKSGQPFEFHYPIMVGFEIYVENPF